MNYSEELRKQREAAQLTQEEAAKKLQLSVRAYQDREASLADMNLPERAGILVGLGMHPERALKVAAEAAQPSLRGTEVLAKAATDASDPFVRETVDAFVLIDRHHDRHEYIISKDTVKTPANILGWIDHLSQKAWVNRDHLGSFAARASTYLGLRIHPVG